MFSGLTGIGGSDLPFADDSHTITYEIAGPDRAVVSMNYRSRDEDDTIGEPTEVTLPWRSTVRTEGSEGRRVLAVATSKPLSGPVVCRIWEGDRLLAERTLTSADVSRQLGVRNKAGVTCETVVEWQLKR